MIVLYLPHLSTEIHLCLEYPWQILSADAATLCLPCLLLHPSILCPVDNTFFRLAISHFSSFPYWTELHSKAIDKWEQNLELFHLLSTQGPASPQTPWWHSGVDLRQTPEGWLWFTKMPLFVSGEKRAGKPLQFLTESEEEEEKEEGRSARLVLSLSLCLCWVGCCFEEVILTLQTLPPLQGLPGNQNLLSVYHVHSFSIQSRGWIIYKGANAF